MKKQVRIFPIIISALCVVATSYGNEPTYRNKPASFWVKQLGSDDSFQARIEAKEAIRALGTNLIPHLLNELKDLAEPWKSSPTNFAQNPALAKRQANLLSAFDALGPIAQPSVPVIKKHITDSDLAAGVLTYALVKIDPLAAIIVLTDCLTNRNNFVRAAAADNLCSLGTNAAMAVPSLIACLKDESSDTNGYSNLRIFSANGLGEVGRHDSEAASALMRVMINDKNGPVRRAAARALANFDFKAPETVPVLARAIKNDEAWQVRVEAAKSLSQLGTNAVKSLPDLYLVSTNDADHRVRVAADLAKKTIEQSKGINHKGGSPQY